MNTPRISEELWQDALKARETVSRAMTGRMGDVNRPSAAVAAAVSVLAGPGNHIETGVLWGGSLLTVAVLRKQYELRGKVIGVDPLNGYYMAGPTTYSTPNDRMQIPVTPETVMENAERLGVADMIDLVTECSYPWPKRLKARRVVSAHLDGDHWGDGPARDIESVASRGALWITMDNYPEGISDGFEAVRTATDALLATGAFHLVSVISGVAILERTSDER